MLQLGNTTIYLIFQEIKSKIEFKAVSCLQWGEPCKNQEVLRVAEAETLVQTTESKGKFKGAWPFNKKLFFLHNECFSREVTLRQQDSEHWECKGCSGGGRAVGLSQEAGK